MSYGLAFAADLDRIRQLISRVDRCLLGNPFGIDREAMAKELGFEGLLWNSMGAVADRDFVSEMLQY